MDDDDIIKRLFIYEGGYVNNPADKGGPTNLGITAATLGAWEGLPGPASAEQVRNMPVTVAASIYKKRYIADPGFDGVENGGLRMIVVDCAVLYGPKRAAMWLQTALGVGVDGVVGPTTLKALSTADVGAVGRSIIGYRIQRIHDRVAADPTQQVFYKGWMNRTNDLTQFVGTAA
jgi:lysozyme family protein